MKDLGQKTQENDTLNPTKRKPANRKNNVYITCVLIFLVVVAALSFFIGWKKQTSDENTAEEEMANEGTYLTVYGEMSREELIEQIKNGIVQIEVEVPMSAENATTMVGSGVVLEITEEYIDIVTASHVVEETAKPLVYFYDGSLAYGSVLAYGKESDIAFVRVEARDLSEGIGEQLSAVKCADNTAYDNLPIGAEMFLVGSVSKVAGNIESGVIEEKSRFVELFQNHMLLCEATVIGGMSGGGAFYIDGNLIGVIVGTNGSEAVSVAIPDVMAEYRSL